MEVLCLKEATKPEEVLDVVVKKKKLIEQVPPEPGQPSPGQLTADKVYNSVQVSYSLMRSVFNMGYTH